MKAAPLIKLLGVGALAAVALSHYWIEQRRPAPIDQRTAVDIVVSHDGDAGPGSLRAAILAADRSPTRMRILLQVARLRVETALPPLTNPLGTVIEGGDTPVVLDASSLDSGAALHIASPGSTVRGLVISGAAERAMQIDASDVRLENVELRDSGEGLRVLPNLVNVHVVDVRFLRNEAGLRIDGPTRNLHVERCTFSGHSLAGFWFVSPDDEALEGHAARVFDSRFDHNTFGVVLGDLQAAIENNDFDANSQAAVQLLGSYGVVRGNRIRGGSGTGIGMENSTGIVVAGNQIEDIAGIGVMVKGRYALLEDNRLQANDYGIVAVLAGADFHPLLENNVVAEHRYDGLMIIGGAAVLRNNRVENNRLAGVRLVPFIVGDQRIESEPLLEANVLEGNHWNVRRESAPPAGSAGSGL